jgi:hypothetical protein
MGVVSVALAGAVVGIVIGAIATAAVLAAAAFAAYKQLTARNDSKHGPVLPQYNPFAKPYGDEPLQSCNVAPPAAAAAAAACKAGSQQHQVAVMADDVSSDEGMVVGFTGEELSSALRNVQHAVSHTLVIAVEDSPLGSAGGQAMLLSGRVDSVASKQ